MRIKSSRTRTLYHKSNPQLPPVLNSKMSFGSGENVEEGIKISYDLAIELEIVVKLDGLGVSSPLSIISNNRLMLPKSSSIS